MMYHLFVPLADTLPGVNVFRYLTFRAAWCLITALAVSAALYPALIAWMRERKKAQIIRDDGPESHRLTKVGTPTMGGLVLIAAVLLSTLLWGRLDTAGPWLTLWIMVGYGAIGFYDDWKKVMEQSSAGLAGRYKILLQVLIGGVALGVGVWAGALEPVVPLPFLKDVALDLRGADGGFGPLSALWVLFALVMLIGASNAVNLTDGLDGLAIGPVMTSAATYGVLAYVSGNARFAEYLAIPFVPGAGELLVLTVALVGAGLGFLWYNAYPASIFMGDTGSLPLGGVLAMIALLTHHELLLVVVGGVFVMEALSVMIQVASFKSTGRRVFLMSPVHHHFEKLGWSEPKIIVRFWILSIVCALVALSTLKLR